MNMTYSQKLIEELAVAILEGAEEDIIHIKSVIDTLPNAEELHDLITKEMVKITIEAMSEDFATYVNNSFTAATSEEVKQDETHVLADSIRKQMEEPQVNLEELIKKQITEKKEQDLADLIGKQVKKADMLENIVEVIVDNVIYQELLASEDEEELHLSLHPSSIEYYEEIFKDEFEAIMAEKGSDMEYTPEITEKAMNKLVNYLQFEMGAEVGFVKAGDILCPVLSIQ